jgi:hypothetical protein
LIQDGQISYRQIFPSSSFQAMFEVVIVHILLSSKAAAGAVSPI